MINLLSFSPLSYPIAIIVFCNMCLSHIPWKYATEQLAIVRVCMASAILSTQLFQD